MTSKNQRPPIIHLWGLILLCGLLLRPVHTSSAEEVTSYPTVDALHAAVIPPADRVDLARRLLGVTEVPPPPASARTRQVGEQQAFWVSNQADERTFQVDAALRVVGEHIYLWVEEGAAVPDDQLVQLAETFDTRVYPQVRELWGSELVPGIDGDPRIYALFARDLGSFILAYYAGRHSYPDEVIGFSNEHEMLFFNLDNTGLQVAQPYVESVMAHEFQHMVRDNVDANEDSWLDEGFSMFTEYFLGYEDALWSASAFMQNLDTQLNTWAYNTDTSPHYGAGLLWVNYFYQRYGLNAVQRLSADSANGLTGFDNALRALGEPGVDVFFADWVLANVIQNKSLADGRYGYGATVAVPLPDQSVLRYPFSVTQSLSQYATHFYDLLAPSETESITVNFTMPHTIALLPTQAASGQHGWYSNRGDRSEMTLTRAFDLSAVSSATLLFQLWYAIERGWDYGYVMVSIDDGATWSLLDSPEMTDFNPHGNAYGLGYSGESLGWVAESLSLDAYAGRANVLVRFALITDDATLLPGMFIDDVAIPQIGYFSDFEGDGDEWTPQGFIWTDNRLPQQVWVQAAQVVGESIEVTRWLATDETHTWTLPIIQGAVKVALTVSPFAPVTTVPMPYTLEITVP